MRDFAVTPGSSTGFLRETTLFTEEMSTTIAPAVEAAHMTTDQITAVAASFCSLLIFVVVLVLVSIIYRRDPQCCKICSYEGQHGDMDTPPQYHSSRQMLVGSPCLEQTQITEDNRTQQAGQLFYVGLPSSYSLPTLEAPLPRLPSYESVRKKDRQRQIHMMIADRFGLNGPIVTEPPPTYEESVRQSVELPYNIFPSNLDISPPPRVSSNTGPDSPHPVSSDTNSPVLPV